MCNGERGWAFERVIGSALEGFDHKVFFCFVFDDIFNPIPAGVLENQDMLEGGQFDPPPSKSHVLCPNMTNALVLYF